MKGSVNVPGIGTMGAATSSTAGKAGLVPAPAAGAQAKYLRGDGTWQTPTNTTYSEATTSKAGLMSAADKTKLDGVATGANKYVHPSYTAKSNGLYKVTVDATGHVSAVSAVAKSDITKLGIAGDEHQHDAGDIASGTLATNRIPNLSASKITSGTLPVARGGTGATSLDSLATTLSAVWGGKRTARFTVGTSASGWTTKDCDYLCDGTDDQVEINAAIQALPSTGGEIVILDGTYNITATIAMNKDNVKLSGNGAATILKRMWDSSSREGVITITATNGGCCIASLQFDGNETNYTSIYNYGISLLSSSNNTITGNTCNNNKYGISLLSSSSNNTITGNTCNNNGSQDAGISLSSSNNTITGNTCNNNGYGINLSSSSNNTITGNTCNNNNNDGIYLSSSSNNTITGNTCNDNKSDGIYLSSSSNNTITGNTALRGTGTSSDYTTWQRTIYLRGTDNNYNLIANNNIMGKNYVSDGGTSDTFVGNKYN